MNVIRKNTRIVLLRDKILYYTALKKRIAMTFVVYTARRQQVQQCCSLDNLSIIWKILRVSLMLSVQWEPRCGILADRHIDRHDEEIVAFRNFTRNSLRRKSSETKEGKLYEVFSCAGCSWIPDERLMIFTYTLWHRRWQAIGSCSARK